MSIPRIGKICAHLPCRCRPWCHLGGACCAGRPRARPAGRGAPLFALAAGCCRWGAVHVPRRVAVAAVARARRVAVGGGVGRWDPAHDRAITRPWHSEYNSTHYSTVLSASNSFILQKIQPMERRYGHVL